MLQIFEGDDPSGAAERAAVTAWHAHQAELLEGQAILVCRDNDRRRRLNDAARLLLASDGRLGPAFRCGDREFAVGDRVICRRNAPPLDVDNGTRGTLIALDGHAESVRLRTDSGAERLLPAHYCAQHLEPAYALTAHGAQGAIVEWAVVIGAPGDFPRNWAYTALSRSRGPAELFVVDDPERYVAERAGIAPSAPGPARDALAKLRRAMARRDDEDLALDLSRESRFGRSARRARDRPLVQARTLGPCDADAREGRRATALNLFD